MRNKYIEKAYINLCWTGIDQVTLQSVTCIRNLFTYPVFSCLFSKNGIHNISFLKLVELVAEKAKTNYLPSGPRATWFFYLVSEEFCVTYKVRKLKIKFTEICNYKKIVISICIRKNNLRKLAHAEIHTVKAYLTPGVLQSFTLHVPKMKNS